MAFTDYSKNLDSDTCYKSMKHVGLSLVAITSLAVAAKLSLGTNFAVFPSLMIIMIAVATLIWPWLGVIALLPMSFALEAAPQDIGLRELSFALLCNSIIVSAIFSTYRDKLITKEIRSWITLGVAVALLLSLNFSVAVGNSVPLSDWLRGVLPFAFLAIFWPITIFLKKYPNLIKYFILSLTVTAMLFVGQILVVYWYEGLYVPRYYYQVDGNFINVDTVSDATGMGPKQGPFYDRVTTYLSQSTDALLPLTFSVGFVVTVLSVRRPIYLIAGIVTYIAGVSILATVTRSMLLCALLSVGLFGLSLLLFRRQYFMRGLLFGIGLVAVLVTTLFAIGVDELWNNRALQLYYSLGIDQIVSLISDWCTYSYASAAHYLGHLGDTSYVLELPKPPEALPPSPEFQAFAKDVNVTTRFKEYRIALERFYAQPITGAGLGIRHEIYFETSFGEKLIQQVGYVHNWVFYFLMVSGLIGFTFYSALLCAPTLILAAKLWIKKKGLAAIDLDQYLLFLSAISVGFLTMALYSLFFAVFRLITFNLVIAAGVAITTYLIFQLNREKA